MTDESFLNTVHPRKGADIIPIGLSLPVGETRGRAVQRIVRALDPEKIILFGSFAYGDPTSDSDVDLLVVGYPYELCCSNTLPWHSSNDR